MTLCDNVESFFADFEYYVEEKTNLQLELSKQEAHGPHRLKSINTYDYIITLIT